MASRPSAVILAAALIVICSSALGVLVNVAVPGGVPLAAAPLPKSAPLIGFKEAWDAFDAGSTVFIDARPAGEYALGHIRGALNVPYLMRQKSLPALKRRVASSRPLIVYCDGEDCEQSGRLSGVLLRAGWRHVRVFKDGYPAWLESGMPVSTGEKP